MAAIAAAGVAGVTIKRAPKEGQVNKYRMKAELEYMGMEVTFDGKVQEKITKVDTDGSFTVDQSQLETKILVGGSEMPNPTSDSTPTTTVFSSNGSVKEIKGDGINADAYRMATLSSFVDAGKELNVGDTWTYDFKADAKTGAVAAKGEFKYLGDEKVGETDAYKIKAVINEIEGATPASSDSTMWLDKADGRMIKMEGKWIKAPIPGLNQPIDATVSMTLEP
jgi:hypothetical protein